MDAINEEKGMVLEDKARSISEKELKIVEGIWHPFNTDLSLRPDLFHHQNELLSEFGMVLQRKMEDRQTEIQQLLGELFQQLQRNAALAKKLVFIQSQTSSLHDAVVRPQDK